MSKFGSEFYQSDITLFLQHMHRENPALEQQQRDGHYRLRNANMDPAIRAELTTNTVPKTAYTYFSDLNSPADPVLPEFWNKHNDKK